ncbi:hypothetical protein A8F94_15680 [Bacillus sp. FJAT-27225]|uniref:hypothetical protein n=1 Tax=Bacillus sp. FJAT-27225 TaxID=1743144 RepID=UPI00080C2DE6|nr:hypothetical protein [Bacillus sp. FJAT-27225]OCA84161.1 hypothetical protein A8F94_15680 [Bacillus sp. FJAT-27225]
MMNQETFGEERNNGKSAEVLRYEKEVALGLWVQVVGQLIELKGLSGLLQLEKDVNLTGEQQILTGVSIRTIGQLLEAISVTKQIYETDILRLLQEQKIAIAGDILAAIGSALEAGGGLQVLNEESSGTTRIVP